MLTKIKITSLKAFALRHLYPLKRDFDLLSDMAYWPLIDTALWGITGQWLVESSGNAKLASAILFGLLIWNVMWRSQAEVGRNLIEEIWNNNLVNLFATPITLLEWVCGVLLLSVVKTLFTLTIVTTAVLVLYSVNVFTLGFWIVPFFLSTMMTGWWIGFISAGIVLRFGPKIQTVVWTLPGIMLPFSAIYFPVEMLPKFIQPISWLIPTTHVLESMRGLVQGTPVVPQEILISFGLNFVFLTLAILHFVKSFEYSKKLGLGRFN